MIKGILATSTPSTPPAAARTWPECRFRGSPCRRRLQAAKRGDGQRVGDQGHAEAVRLAVDDRQAHAVDGDRAFRGHLPAEFARHGEPEGRPVAANRRAPTACPAPSMWPLTKCPPKRSPTASARSRFTGLPGFNSPRLVRASVSGPAWKANVSPSTLDHRQAAAVDARCCRPPRFRRRFSARGRSAGSRAAPAGVRLRYPALQRFQKTCRLRFQDSAYRTSVLLDASSRTSTSPTPMRTGP